jgi:hypothetical protein
MLAIKKMLSICILGGIFAQNTKAQEDTPFRSDATGYGVGTELVGKRKFQLETTTNFSMLSYRNVLMEYPSQQFRISNYSEPFGLNANTWNLRYGLSNRVELRVGLPVYSDNKFTISPIRLEGKFAILKSEERKTELSALAFVNIHTKYSPMQIAGLSLLGTTHFNDNFRLRSSLGYEGNPFAQQHVFKAAGALEYSHLFGCSQLGGFVQVAATMSKEKTKNISEFKSKYSTSSATIGLNYLILPNLQLSLSNELSYLNGVSQQKNPYASIPNTRITNEGKGWSNLFQIGVAYKFGKKP